MEFFIDTADLEQISLANELGVLDGVTTSPSLMANEGIYQISAQILAASVISPLDIFRCAKLGATCLPDSYRRLPLC